MLAGAQAQTRREPSLREMLDMRMRWRKQPFSFIQLHKENETVFVFIVAGGVAQIMEDDANMFPSDALITKLRLLPEGNS